MLNSTSCINLKPFFFSDIANVAAFSDPNADLRRVYAITLEVNPRLFWRTGDYELKSCTGIIEKKMNDWAVGD